MSELVALIQDALNKARRAGAEDVSVGLSGGGSRPREKELDLAVKELEAKLKEMGA